ncbi:MAG: M48 family metalloprotease, partial [Thermoplasmata archaeon]
LLMTMLSAIPIFAYIVARGIAEMFRYSGTNVRSSGGSRGGGGKGSGSKGDGGLAGLILAAIIIGLLAFLVYLLTMLLVKYLSRSREYYADTYSAETTGNPYSLASALVKISYGLSLAPRKELPSGLRAFFVSDPVTSTSDITVYKKKMEKFDLDGNGVIDDHELELAIKKERTGPWRKANEIFRTHPPMYKRVLLLMKMDSEIRQRKSSSDTGSPDAEGQEEVMV